MHRLITIAAALLCTAGLLFTANSAWALSCSPPPRSYWPSTAVLSPQPYLVLQNEKMNTAWFEGPTRIDATVTKVGQFDVIRPVKPLTVGATYTLVGTVHAGYQQAPTRWVDNTRVPLMWTIKVESTPAPIWKSEIVVGKGRADKGGWGPSSSQILNLDFTSDGPVLAEVALVRGKSSTTLLRPVEAGKPLRFGRGPCGGTVHLIGEGVWTASVTLIGPSGQRSKTKTAQFVTPVPTGY